MTVEERARVEQAIGAELSSGFESKMAFKKDPEVSIFLRGIAEKLIGATPELKFSAVGVLLIADFQGKWQSFSLPGNRIYLSTGLLKRASYENEVAAAIAFELGHLLNGSVLRKLQQNRDSSLVEEGGVPPVASTLEGLVLPDPSSVRSVEYFGPRGALTFGEEAHLKAAELAVGMLYRAGYDPRGLTGIWQLYESHPEKSPFAPELLGKLVEKTRRVLAQNAPLRNPVVRSHAFLEIQKRIKRL